MSAVSTLPENIVDWLNAQTELEDITFMTEFPPTKKAIPLKKPIVAVGLDSVRITDSFTENDQGVLERNEYCRLANMRISLLIHVPFSMGGEKCHDIFTDVTDALTFASDLNIVQSGCGNISSDRNTDALVLEAWIDVTADFCPAASSDMNYQSFLAKTFLCATHITDENIHVTAQDKEKWDSPSVSGGYVGNGSTSRSVSLGFRPSFVTVFAAQYPPVLTDFTNQRSYCYSGFAMPDYGSQGIEINSTGFKLLSSSTYVIDACYPCLNEAGMFYRYVAFK